jgi:hypothetical protein
VRAKEFILEQKKDVIDKDQERALSNTMTFPNQNMYHGSGYLHSQFLKALAGAGAGNTPDGNMGTQPWDGGNPVYTPFAPEEEEMIDHAAKHVGDTSKRKWGSNRSEESEDTHKVSPVVIKQRNRYGV